MKKKTFRAEKTGTFLSFINYFDAVWLIYHQKKLQHLWKWQVASIWKYACKTGHFFMYNLFINPVHCSLFTHDSKDVKRKGYATTSTSRSKSGLRVIKSNKWDQIETQIDVNNWKVLFILEKNPVELTLCGCLQPFSNLLLNPSLRYFDLCILDRTSAAHEVFPFIPR